MTHRAASGFSAFAKRVAASRTSQVFFVLHTIILVYALVERQAERGDSEFHFFYEPLAYKLLVTLDLPALLFGMLILIPFAHEASPISQYWWAYWVQNLVMAVFVSLQWLLIGYILEKLITNIRHALTH